MVLLSAKIRARVKRRGYLNSSQAYSRYQPRRGLEWELLPYRALPLRLS